VFWGGVLVLGGVLWALGAWCPPDAPPPTAGQSFRGRHAKVASPSPAEPNASTSRGYPMPAMSRLHNAGNVPTMAPIAPAPSPPSSTQEAAHHAWGHRNAWGASASASPHALSGGGGGGLAWGASGAPSCCKNHGGSNAPASAKQRVGAEYSSSAGVSMLASTSTASLPNSYEQSLGGRAMHGGALVGANRGPRASTRPGATVTKASSTGPLPQQPSQPPSRPRASSLPSSPVMLHKLDVQGLEVFPKRRGASATVEDTHYPLETAAPLGAKLGAPGLAPSQQPQRGASNAASYAQSYVRAQRFMRRAQAFTPPPHLPSHGSAGLPHFR